MANAQRLFFYAPTWDYPPGGPIKLGNVLSSVKTLNRPLHYAPPPEDSDVYATKKKSVCYTKEKLRSGKFSILTRFLSVLGFRVDFGAEVNNSDEVEFFFDTIETTCFTPSSSYLQECIETGIVRDFLERSRYRKPVYVVTGLKIATGVRANSFESHTVSGALAAEVDGTIWSGGSAPVGVGSSVKGSVGNKAIVKWEGSDNFVFAFSMSKVTVGKVSGQVEHVEDYRKGAMLANEDETQVRHPELSVLKVEEADADYEEFDTQEVMEDKDIVLCANTRETRAS